MQVPIEWEEVDVTPILVNGKTAIPDVAIHSVKKNTVALKGTSSEPSTFLYPKNAPFRTPCYA